MFYDSILRIQQMKLGNYILLFSLFITLNSFLLFLSSILQPNHYLDHSGRSLLSVNLITSISDSGSVLINKFNEENIGRIPINKAQLFFKQPIDIVYTWVNGSDPEHIKAIKKAKAEESRLKGFSYEESDDGKNRYEDHNELLYSLRSVYKYAPWVRRIYLVTNGQLPSWLNIYHPNLHIVTHDAIFKNQSHLPCFSSPAIESNLHNIPGLSNNFIYLNDDTMFGSEIHLSDFITPGGGQKVFYSWGVPDCNDGCPSNWLGDGFCDNACNVASCNFDNGDCSKDNSSSINPTHFDNQNSYCSLGCFEGWIGDNYCDRSCKTPECGMDGGDCGIEEVILKLNGYNLEKNKSEIYIPDSISHNSLYINLTDAVGSSKILSAIYSDSKIIRTSVIKRNNNMLILVLNRNITREKVEFRLTLSDVDNSNLIFNVSLNTVHDNEDKINNTENSDKIISGDNVIPESSTIKPNSLESRVNLDDISSQSKKVDTYADSLRYVNNLLNKEFGAAQRYVPAHMPHFLQKDVLIRMHQLWKNEFAKTSSNRFRSSDDMQFALSYFYFLMNEKKNYSIDSLFHDEWDLNKDNLLDKYELRALISKISDHSHHVSSKDIDDNLLTSETSYDHIKKYFLLNDTSEIGKITLDQITNMTELMDKIHSYYSKRLNNKFEIVEESQDIGFIMIKTNKTTTSKKLDSVLSLRHKFLCLNDDLNYSDPHAEEVVSELIEFFNIMYPNPSPFEMKDGKLNPYYHVNQLIEAKNRIYTKRIILYFTMCGIIALIFCIITFYPKSHSNFKKD